MPIPMNISSSLSVFLSRVARRTTKGKAEVDIRKRLPQEIVDYILDFLWYDRKSLRTCAIVCSSWRTTCQTHLFNQIHIRNTVSFARQLTTLEAHDALAGYVRDLCLHEHIYEDGAEVSASWVPRALRALSTRSRPPFPNITRLCLHLARPDGALPFAHLTRLTFVTCRFRTFRAFAACVRGAPHLRALDVLTCDWADAVLPEDNDDAPPLALRLLSVDARTAALMHGWLARTRSLGAIRTLSAYPCPAGAVAFHDFVPDPACLERLQLLHGAAPSFLNLAGYTRLVHLFLELGADWFPAVAPLFALPALRVLSILYSVDEAPWERLADALLDGIAREDAPADGDTDTTRYRTVNLILRQVWTPDATQAARATRAAVERFQGARTGRTLERGVLWVYTCVGEDPEVLGPLRDSVF